MNWIMRNYLLDQHRTLSKNEKCCIHCRNLSIPCLSPHDCAHTRLCPHTFVPTHVCAHTRLCPDRFVPTHVCAHTRLCPHSFVPRHFCAHTCLYPNTFVPWHVIIVWSQSCLGRNVYVCVQTCYNKITKYSSRNTACDCLTVVK